MNSIFDLHDKVAVVTGGSGLLGSQFCKALSAAGATVVVADIDLTECEDTVEELANPGLAVRADVCDVASLLNLKSEVLSRYGHLDILVNNAAINDAVEGSDASRDLAMFEHFPLSLWNRVLQVNVTGVFLSSQILGEAMLPGGGSIINIASTYGVVAPDQRLYHDGEQQRFIKSPAYPASKAAVIGFTKYLAAYWASSNIRVNALSPGGVLNEQDEYFIHNYSQRAPMARMASADEYNGAVVFLASSASSYMTGANLIVDGGWTAI